MSNETVIRSPYGYDPMNGQPLPPSRQERKADSVDFWTALASFASAYVYSHAITTYDQPWMSLILTVLFFAIAAAYLYFRKVKLPKAALWLPVSSLILSVSYLTHNQAFIHFLVFQWAKLSCFWFIAIGLGTAAHPIPDEFIFWDLCKSWIVAPFARFFSLFPAIFTRVNMKRKTLGWVLLGLAATLIPCIIIINLLSFDEAFAARMDGLLHGEWLERLLEELMYLFMALPISMVFFSSLTYGYDGDGKKLFTEESVRAGRQKAACAPLAFGAAILIPVLVIYVVFFLSQWEQYYYAFLFRLPDRFNSYAQYAREGFFQLCAVAAINAVLMFAARCFVRKDENGRDQLLMVVLNVIFCLATLGLLTTALAKMALYVKMYGLTPKRVYTSWLMIAMFCGFFAALVSVFVKKLRLVPTLFVIGLLFFGSACLFNTNRWIAQSNIDAYVSGDLKKLDIKAMWELDLDAVPVVYENLEDGTAFTDEKTLKDVHSYLCETLWMEETNDRGVSVWSCTPARMRAMKCLQEYKEKYAQIYGEFTEQVQFENAS